MKKKRKEPCPFLTGAEWRWKGLVAGGRTVPAQSATLHMEPHREGMEAIQGSHQQTRLQSPQHQSLDHSSTTNAHRSSELQHSHSSLGQEHSHEHAHNPHVRHGSYVHKHRSESENAWPDPRKYNERSLFLFQLSNPLRRRAIAGDPIFHCKIGIEKDMEDRKTRRKTEPRRPRSKEQESIRSKHCFAKICQHFFKTSIHLCGGLHKLTTHSLIFFFQGSNGSGGIGLCCRGSF